MSAPVENLVSRLHAKRSGKGWIAKCPAHDDRKPSLSIDEGLDGRALLKCHAGCDTNDVLAALGLTPADLFIKSPTTTYQRQSSNGAFDWQTCVDALKAKDLVRLGNERWYSRAFCSWLHEQQLVGFFNGCIAFPVHSNGTVIGAHYRLDDGSWRYTPTGAKTAPLVIGDLSNAKQVHLDESQWDVLALADRTDLYREKSVAFIATRGAGNAALVKGLIPQSASVLAWPQNDKAGEKWLTDLCADAGVPVAKAPVPAQFKDVNEWTKAGASPKAIYDAFWRNELVYEPPKPKSVDLATLLDEVCAYLKRFVVFTSEAQPIAIALWIAHTWIVDAFDYTPYLDIWSPEKRCGKTKLLDCLELLVRKAWRAVSPSEPVLYRKIERDQPTLLLDEVDTVFSGNKDERKEPLRALLNAGFERKAKVPRCVGQGSNYQVQEFAVFCAKAFAGIDRLPDTISDRCIQIRLIRRSRDESVQRFRKRDAETATAPIREALESWSQQHGQVEKLRAARPEIPNELDDRQLDICEPLFAIADVAGGDWPQRCRESLVSLCAAETDEDESRGVKLLSAIRAAFEATDADRLATKELLEQLVNQETDAPWPGWWENDLRNGNTRGPAARLARLLKPYGIKARGIRLPDGTTPRGYIREDFTDAWKRYCPPKTA